jgi:hypothetical protein
MINRFTYGTTAAEFVFHPFPISYYTGTLNAISSWVIPDNIPQKVRVILISAFIVILILVAIYIAFKNRKRHMDENYRLNSKIIGVFSFNIFFYLIILLSARYFFNAAIEIDDVRMLLPFLLSIFIVFLFFIKRFLDFYSHKENMRIIAYVFCGILITTSILNNTAIELYRYGQWYSTRSWSESETIKELKEFHQSQNFIYTNDPAAIYLFLGKNPNYLPIKYNMHTDRTNSNYQRDLNTIMEEIKEKDGLIVFFDWGFYFSLAQEHEITKDYELNLIKDTIDGAIYKINN